jgi:hypothetical protein
MSMGYSCINFWVPIDITISWEIKNLVQVNYFLHKILYVDGLS